MSQDNLNFTEKETKRKEDTDSERNEEDEYDYGTNEQEDDDLLTKTISAESSNELKSLLENECNKKSTNSRQASFESSRNASS